MDTNETNNQKPKKRSLTELTLGWLAERIRKAEEIKAEISKGNYSVDSEKIAQSIVNKQ